MLGTLERCQHLLIRFGGHRQAAGLSLDAGRIRELSAAVNAVADETLGPEDLMPRLRIDGDLSFRSITGGVAAGVAALAPFGAGNPRPVFAARRVEIVDGPRTLKERHLKMALKQDGRIFRAIAWRSEYGDSARCFERSSCRLSPGSRGDRDVQGEDGAVGV